MPRLGLGRQDLVDRSFNHMNMVSEKSRAVLGGCRFVAWSYCNSENGMSFPALQSRGVMKIFGENEGGGRHSHSDTIVSWSSENLTRAYCDFENTFTYGVQSEFVVQEYENIRI